MRGTPTSLTRWLMAANIAFITPKMLPTAMMTTTTMLAYKKIRFVPFSFS